jgi:hypothetical protein
VIAIVNGEGAVPALVVPDDVDAVQVVPDVERVKVTVFSVVEYQRGSAALSCTWYCTTRLEPSTLTSTAPDSLTIAKRVVPFSYVTVSLAGLNRLDVNASLIVLRSLRATPAVVFHTSPSRVMMRSDKNFVSSMTPSV